MDIALEALTFIGGCLFYAFRGAVGKLLLGFIVACGKRLFKSTEQELKLYEAQRLAHLHAKRSAKPRAR